MSSDPGKEMALLERAARTQTALILSLTGLAASFGSLFLSGASPGPEDLLYPLLTALLLYLAGDLLALVWFRLLAARMLQLLVAERRHSARYSSEENLARVDIGNASEDDSVEVIRPAPR